MVLGVLFLMLALLVPLSLVLGDYLYEIGKPFAALSMALTPYLFIVIIYVVTKGVELIVGR